MQEIASQMANFGSDAISAVDRLLNSRDKHLRLAGTTVLSAVKHPRAAPGLIHALQDVDNAVRLQAAVGLGRHKTRPARLALFSAFPDRLPSISIALLRSMENMLTPEMADGLRAMDQRRLAPQVRTELDNLLARAPAARSKPRERPAPVKQTRKPPLASAPWLRLLPGGRCVGHTTPGLEQTVATVLAWRIPGVRDVKTEKGKVSFTVTKADIAKLVQVRLLESVSLQLERAAGVPATEDKALINPLYAFAHAKGLQSLVMTGQISSIDARVLGHHLGLRSARPPGYADTLRLHITERDIFAEFLTPGDYPTLRNMAATSRTLASCLAALSVSGPHDVFCDPFCGDGSVVVERSLLGAWRQGYAYDPESARLSVAKEGWRILAPLGENPVDSLQLASWQETQLPLADGSVDAMASILSPETVETLMPYHLAELGRTLRIGGRAAFLLADGKRLSDDLRKYGLTVQQIITVGDPPLGEIIVLTK